MRRRWGSDERRDDAEAGRDKLRDTAGGGEGGVRLRAEKMMMGDRRSGDRTMKRRKLLRLRGLGGGGGARSGAMSAGRSTILTSDEIVESFEALCDARASWGTGARQLGSVRETLGRKRTRSRNEGGVKEGHELDDQGLVLPGWHIRLQVPAETKGRRTSRSGELSKSYSAKRMQSTLPSF